MALEEEFWEDRYAGTAAEALPWNAGGPDENLVRLVQNGRIPVGQALEIGSGLGHDAIFLMQQGFPVIAIDISATAIGLARANASGAGLFGFFQKGDIRRIPVEDGFIDFAHDRACFHVLDEADRLQAAAEVHRVLRPRGLFLLQVCSDQEPEPPGEGPHHFGRRDLEELFGGRFRSLEFGEGIFGGPRKAKNYTVLLEKK